MSTKRPLSGKQLVRQLSDLKALAVNLKGCINIRIRRQFTSVERDWEESVIEGAEHLKFVRIAFWNQDFWNEERVAEETIMKRLQPHLNLKKFELYSYMGKTIKGWGSAHDNWATILPNLVEINLLMCYRLQQLPLLSELLYLKHLKLVYLLTLEYMEEVSSRSSESKFTFFPSLETLEIRNCEKLKGWSRGNRSNRFNCQLAFPRLSSLEIAQCRELTSFPTCPSLYSLHLRENNKALRITTTNEGQSSSSSALSCYNEKSSSNPNPWNLGLFTVDHIAHLKLMASPFVTKLQISHNNEVESLSEVDEMCKRFSSLKSLDIYLCSKLTSVCGVLEHLTALHSLSLRDCDVLKLEEGEHGDDDNGMPWRALHSSLRSLSLVGLLKVHKLPMGMKYLTSLQHLKIEWCDNLKEIPVWVGCLQSLQSLHIWRCNAITSLPDAIGCLQSLQFLTIAHCDAITSLPDAMVKLTSLQKLDILDCQGLKERCSEPNGQDWPKIQHIPDKFVKIRDMSMMYN